MQIINHLIQTHSREGKTEAWQEALTCQWASSLFLPSYSQKWRESIVRKVFSKFKTITSSPLLKPSHWLPVLQLQDTSQAFAPCSHQHLFCPRTFACAFYSLGNVSCSSPSTFTFTLLAHTPVWGASQVALVVKNPPVNAGDIRDAGSIPGSGRSPGWGHDNPLQYSCLKNPMDRGSRQTSVQRVTQSWTRLKRCRTHALIFEISVDTFLLQKSHFDLLNHARALSENLFAPCTSSEYCLQVQFV